METLETTPQNATAEATGGITAPLDINAIMDILPHR